MTVVFFDCFSGAAGDMILAALLDAGAPEADVRRNLDALRLPGWHLEISPTARGGFRALRAVVNLDNDEPHRSYRDVRAVIENAELSDRVRDRALRVFARLAEAEARVHGTPVEEVVFHEVGATDAVVDIVGTCAALEHFAPTAVAASAIATGTGTVVTDHGELPLPAPAVAELLKGVPIFGRGGAELVTPTGAALLSTLCDSIGELPPMTLSAVGYGAGARETGSPNVVRVLVGETAAPGDERALLIETNIDDMSPELVPYVMERLLESGAHDVWTTPILMKKARPAITLTVLCDDAARGKLMDVIFSETTTLGLRITSVAKHAVQRKWVGVEVSGCTVRVKIAHHSDAVVTIAPEYEDARAAARATGLPLKEIYARATEAARATTSGSQ